MADLIIPAALRLWLFFLVIVSAWRQIKGGSPSEEPKGLKPVDNLKQPAAEGSARSERFGLPFLKSNKAKRRYMERNKRARERKLK